MIAASFSLYPTFLSLWSKFLKPSFHQWPFLSQPSSKNENSHFSSLSLSSSFASSSSSSPILLLSTLSFVLIPLFDPLRLLLLLQHMRFISTHLHRISLLLSPTLSLGSSVMALSPSISFPVWIIPRRSRLCSPGNTWSIVNVIAPVPVHAVWSLFLLLIRSRFPGPRVGTWWAASFFAQGLLMILYFVRGFFFFFFCSLQIGRLLWLCCWEIVNVMIFDFFENSSVVDLVW